MAEDTVNPAAAQPPPSTDGGDDGGPPMMTDQNAILQRYRELQNECNNYVQKITELETDGNEHRLVEETLEPLDPNRRAFRLVGGVLVERTVGEVLPSVRTNRENLERMVQTLEGKLKERQREAAEHKARYNIRTPEEAEQVRRRQQQAAMAQGQGQGLEQIAE